MWTYNGHLGQMRLKPAAVGKDGSPHPFPLSERCAPALYADIGRTGPEQQSGDDYCHRVRAVFGRLPLRIRVAVRAAGASARFTATLQDVGIPVDEPGDLHGHIFILHHVPRR